MTGTGTDSILSAVEDQDGKRATLSDGRPETETCQAGGPRRGRRGFLRDIALAAVGVGAGTIATGELVKATDRHLGVTDQVADAARNGANEITNGQVTLVWHVLTDERQVALTFDDGPKPRWTTMVLDTLDEYSVPATFFMVGERVGEYRGVVDGRMGRHEVGNHTWAHEDLARCDASQARDTLERAHEAIVDALGVAPVLCRPPYGHLSGSAVLAANDLGYGVVLWNEKMREACYTTEEQIERIVCDTRPGTIVLAHDVGNPDRLISIRGLPGMIEGLRERGFEFVTVSALIGQAASSEIL